MPSIHLKNKWIPNALNEDWFVLSIDGTCNRQIEAKAQKLLHSNRGKNFEYFVIDSILVRTYKLYIGGQVTKPIILVKICYNIVCHSRSYKIILI